MWNPGNIISQQINFRRRKIALQNTATAPAQSYSLLLVAKISITLSPFCLYIYILGNYKYTRNLITPHELLRF